MSVILTDIATDDRDVVHTTETLKQQDHTTTERQQQQDRTTTETQQKKFQEFLSQMSVCYTSISCLLK